MLTALRHRNYRIYWVGALVSFIGTWLQGTALSWLVRTLTPSPFHLGLVAFCGSAPMFIFSLFGGVLADRLDKKQVLVLTQAALGLFAGILAFLTLTDLVRLHHIMIIALASGIASALDVPLRQSFVFHLVGKKDLPNAIAMNSMGFNSARIIGPAFAGVLIARWGQGICFVLNSLSFAAVLVALLLVRVDSRPKEDPTASVWSDLLGGMDYVRHQTTIAALIVMVAIPSIVAFPYGSLLPIFARDVLHLGVGAYGTMLSSAGIGALIGASLLTFLGNRFGRGRVMLGALGLLGIGLLGLSWSRTFPLTLASLMTIGFAMPCYGANTNSLLQLLASERMRGRVMGAYAFTNLGLAPVGSLLVGGMAEMWGVSAAVSVGGVSVILLSAGMWMKRPDIRLL